MKVYVYEFHLRARATYVRLLHISSMQQTHSLCVHVALVKLIYEQIWIFNNNTLEMEKEISGIKYCECNPLIYFFLAYFKSFSVKLDIVCVSYTFKCIRE
jgi:hypothetical protein